MKRRFLALLVVLASAAGLRGAVPDWVRSAAAQDVPPQPDAPAAMVLLDDTLVTVEGTQLRTRHRRVVKILAAAGSDLAWAAVQFGRDGRIVSMRGWAIDSRGEEHEVRNRQAVEATAATYEVYSDSRVRMLRLPAADAGSTVAYEIEETERPLENRIAWRFQETVPVVRARLSLVLPEGMRYAARWFRHPDGKADGPSWEVRNVPAIADEPRMPDLTEIGGWLGVEWADGRSWSDIARWFDALAAPRLAATPEITSQARTLGDIRALARFAQRDVRYVAVEIGIGGYQPHAAADVFRNRFGDCKDKATLLRTMLGETGVRSYYVIVNATRRRVEPDFPTIAAFNHVIAAIQVPSNLASGLEAVVQHPTLGALLLFDPTSTTTPFGQLPRDLEGSRGLLVTPGGGELILLPERRPEGSELRRAAKLRLEEDGTLHGTVEETWTGAMAAQRRELLQPLTAAERVRSIENGLAYHLARYVSSNVVIEHLEDAESPLVVRYAISVSDYATRVADLLLVRPRVLGGKTEAPLAADRRYPVLTDGRSRQVDDFEITLPASLTLDELPKKVAVRTPFLEYESASEVGGGTLRYRRTFTVLRREVAVPDLPSLNQAYAAIGADERASAVFR